MIEMSKMDIFDNKHNTIYVFLVFPSFSRYTAHTFGKLAVDPVPADYIQLTSHIILSKAHTRLSSAEYSNTNNIA